MKTITLDGPGHNALGMTILENLIAELEAADGAPVLLTGAGRSFSAGVNLKEIVTLGEAGLERFLYLLDKACRDLFEYPGPTVAAVNGHAIAGGCILTICCDHRVMTDHPKVRIGLNEVALGVAFPPTLLEIVRYRIPAHTRDMVLLGGGLHSPQVGLQMGLVDELSATPVQLGTERLEALASHAAHAYATTKRALRKDIMGSVSEDELREHVLPAWTSDQTRRRLLAALGL